MTANVRIPKCIAAGTSLRAVLELPANAAGWDALLYLRGPAAIDIEGVTSGRSVALVAVPADTAGWAPGDYAWTVRITNGGDVVQLASGRITVTPDIAAMPAGAETRSQSRIALEAIRAVLAKRATLDQERYRINNRELYRTPIADLLKLEAFYMQRVAEEEGCAKRGRIRSIPVAFRPIG